MANKHNKDTIDNIPEVEEENLAEWDMVICRYCKKKISMLNALLVTGSNGNEYFICKEHRVGI